MRTAKSPSRQHRARDRRRSRARRGQGDLLRDEILEAAEALLVKTNDADAVSIRALAKAVGVTPPSIYLHFETKEQLILEVCERHFRALAEVIGAEVAEMTDPVELVKAMGKAYIRFGLEHPEQYRLLFMTRTPDFITEEDFESVQDLSGFTALVEVVRRCIDDGAFKAGDAFQIACGLWMGVHGVTSLLISKPGFPWGEANALIDHCVDTYCEGLTA